MKYLDPKADLTFKKIFGNHPKRLISLLNALLPLSEEEQIHEIKYLPTELVPQLEGGKNTIVDVLCTDVRGRKFCVEMQMEWSDAFQQQVVNISLLIQRVARQHGEDSDSVSGFKSAFGCFGGSFTCFDGKGNRDITFLDFIAYLVDARGY